ncbi:DUF4492 domain-containing protein [Sulfurovum sp. zt1-1]|uniref:DUF4492 domain-containing protein n=1 Tax=Sulfurovum zhangzhouensis TaxID=3019067 RepID=A0ABT7QY91_9BACT|nr:DUF4492 domain-containing protein [Sulfurovum zhangzhouensis]MDM5271804.1 DUF4492 domain-containing protein [Sulfurovum zhangzhouensis]
MKLTHIITDIIFFYIDGFKQMKVGKKLWLLIGIKLLVLFGIIKFFFFPNYLQTTYDNDESRSAYLIEYLTKER